MSRRKIFWCLLLPVVLSQSVFGNGTTDARSGFFLTLSGQNFSVEGDFDGERVLYHTDRSFFIPRVEKTSSFGIGFGYRTESGLWDAGISRSAQTNFFQDQEFRTSLYSVDLNGRAFLFKKAPIKPYLLLGISVPWMNVRDGAEFEGRTADAKYIGLALSAGAGIFIPLGPKLFISGGAVYRYLGFLYAWVRGKGKDIMDLQVSYDGPKWDNWLRARGVSLTFNIGFSF